MITQNKYDTLKKALAVIESCTTYDQLSVAGRFASNFLRSVRGESNYFWYVVLNDLQKTMAEKRNAIHAEERAAFARSRMPR